MISLSGAAFHQAADGSRDQNAAVRSTAEPLGDRDDGFELALVPETGAQGWIWFLQEGLAMGGVTT